MVDLDIIFASALQSFHFLLVYFVIKPESIIAKFKKKTVIIHNRSVFISGNDPKITFF